MNDGGPAFPQTETRSGNSFADEYPHGGMSLRDYMAAQALFGFQSFVRGGWCGLMPPEMAEHIAKNCYAVADAMLAARAAKGE